MTFELLLAEERVKPRQVTALHLLVALALTGAGALFRLFPGDARNWSVFLLTAGVLLLLLALFRNKWLLGKVANLATRALELLLLMALTVYCYMHHWTPPTVMFGVLAAAVVFSLFWEQGSRQLKVIIDEQGIQLPVTSRKRFIAWRDVENVLLKFGTLTVNCTDNRLFQWTLAKSSIDSDTFTSFCRQQVEKGKLQKDANDW